MAASMAQISVFRQFLMCTIAHEAQIIFFNEIFTYIKLFQASFFKLEPPSIQSGLEVISFFMLNANENEISLAHKKTKMLKNKDFSCFQTLRCCIYQAYKGQNANKCWHFNIYEHAKFHAQFS